jgi:hypothetical protein
VALASPGLFRGGPNLDIVRELDQMLTTQHQHAGEVTVVESRHDLLVLAVPATHFDSSAKTIAASVG